MERKKKPINKVRASRDGHEFHEAWAARKALQLVFPSDELVGIAVEGPSPEDEKTASAASVEVADLVLFYGKKPNFDKARKVAVLQFKYSIRNKRKPVRVSDVKDTVKKFADSYRDHKRRYGATKVARKLSFDLVTNRPIDDGLREAIEKIAVGTSPSNRAKVQADQFKAASCLKGKELAEFARKVRFVGLTGNLKDSKSDLSRTLADWSATSTDALALARLGTLRDLVRDKAGNEGAGRNVIVRTDVFAALGVSGPEELLPSPESFPDVCKVVGREQLDDAVKRIPKVNKPFLVHAEGSIGKTVFLQSLAKSLSGTYKTILFDCFGGGGYRAPEDARHLPRKHRAHRIEPAPLSGNAPNIGNRVAPHLLGSGHLAIRLSQPQTLNDLSYFMHFEPPVSHCVYPPAKCRRLRNRKSETNVPFVLRGLIAPRIRWPHCAANPVALLRREFTGRITPRIGWPQCAANQMALYGRELTILRYQMKLTVNLTVKMLVAEETTIGDNGLQAPLMIEWE